MIMTIIVTITISSNVIGALTAILINLQSCNRTVGCKRTPVIGQLHKPIILSHVI